MSNTTDTLRERLERAERMRDAFIAQADEHLKGRRDQRARAERLEAENRRLREQRNKYLVAAREAYGLLWQDLSGSRKANDARRVLHDVLPKDERSVGIMWANEEYGRVTEEEVMAACHTQPAEQEDSHE